MTRFLGIVLAAAGLLLTASCASVKNPATGETQFTTMSLAEERQIGAQEHPKILAQFGGEYSDTRVTGYVERVGRRLAEHAELPADQFSFTVLDTPVVNAFALPGGYVYMTRGLMSYLNSEAELAGVLGHEIGHVTARHGATRQTRGLFANIAVIGAAVLTGSREVAQLGQVAAAGYLASYSRDQERQSDSLGIRYLSRAGYNPIGMSDGLRALGRHGALLSRMSGREAQGFNFLSTHPQTPERVAATVEEAQQTKAVANARTGRDDYLDAIDGMVFGDSPAQGFARGEEFVHPVLRFAFRVPPGFRLDNLPQAVIATDSKAAARIIFDQEPDRRIASSGVGMDTYIVRHWAGNTRLFNLERITVDGMDGATASAQIVSNNQRLDAQVVAIRFDRDSIYRFMFVTTPSSTRAYNEEFRRTTFSFRRLSESEAGSIQPLRLEIVRVKPGDTISALTRNDVQDGFEEGRFRVINGMDDKDVLRAGDMVKVIR